MMDARSGEFIPPPRFRALGRILNPYAKDVLTVLCYHRVLHGADDRFQGYKPNISAFLEGFVSQMDYLRAHFNPIALRDLVAWLEDGIPLPPRPALVTFDDGYRDNAEVAWPVMRDRRVPAVIFLATDCIGAGRPFIWDVAAYCFSATTKTRIDVPFIPSATLRTGAERDAATVSWVEHLKRVPAATRDDAMRALADALGVPLPSHDVLEHLYLDWPAVRMLAREGVEFGAHTRTHPILTNLLLEEARAEIRTSIEQLELALGAKPLGFAYPNGSARDFSHEHEDVVRQCGLPVAFSLKPGPTRLSEVRDRPMAVRRIYIGMRDNLPRFVAKLSAAARIANFLRA
jgi:peptidoglycan/xylan/chitin deacetylase (PgdA/CDA1 family)